MQEARWAMLALALCGCATRPMSPPPEAPETLILSIPAIGTTIAPAQPRQPVATLIDIPVPDHHSIRAALDLFTTEMRSDIQQSLTRSARYKNLIDRVLDEYKLPKALAYLPVIESAYLPRLTSRAGAHGIWQFMPETAREYGLRVDWWVDERADPDRSTHAAAAYLKDLYREFQDWPLALAAYNAGSARIHRALDQTGSTTFWRISELSAVPRETRGYVPTFFAAILIANDAASYGFRLGDPVKADIKHIEVDGPLSLRFIAQTANIDETLLRELNPALRHDIVPPGKTGITIPAAAGPAIEARAATLKNDDRIVTVRAYRVRKGDTITRLARSLGVARKTILAMNSLSAKAHLRRGESIYLPVRAHALSAGGM
ncbi:MAG TPA: transglycosylase SLT domain-containing protein [Thermoanaerobaculia bacterium]|nr:transglycosylase SLT domain-containing protein [Thermoanaerobaculia bacterium]